MRGTGRVSQTNAAKSAAQSAARDIVQLATSRNGTWWATSAAVCIMAAGLCCGVVPLAAQDNAGAPRSVEAERLIRPGDNLVVEGVPDIPAALADDVRRYTESRSAAMFDWHPTRRQLLVGTRFGNSSQVHLVKRPGGARNQLTFFDEPVAGATFEPTRGNYFVFSRDAGGNEFSQLYRFDLLSGKITLLTDGGRSQNGRGVWSHAGDRMVYGSTRRNGADRDLWIIDPARKATNRLLVELRGGGWRPLDWSPDDAQLLVMEYLSINRSNLYSVDVATGTLRSVTPTTEQVAYGEAKFAGDGRQAFVTSDRDSEFLRLGRLDLESGAFVPLTDDIPWNVEAFELSPDRELLAFVVNEAGVSRLYLLNTQTGERTQVEGIPTGVIGLGPWHRSGREFALTLGSARSTADVYSVDASTRAVTRWTESELGGLVPRQLVEPELVRWKSFDGREISGFSYLPPEKFAGKRPVIINIHGGPEGQSRPNFLGRNNYFLNELGVAIIYPNVRGSDGYGKTFLQLDNGLKRLDSVRDIGALLDWIAEQPRLDASRVMVTGGSYGGFMTLATATTYNDRIACSLDVVGISHFGTFLKNTESYRRDLRRVEYGDERDPELAAFFEEMAPLNQAAKITKPLFVVQGGNDPRVPLSEAEQMVARVRENGTPLWYLMAKDEGHGFRKKNNADFQFYATVMFVKAYLLGERE
jgi:dipeptidyl aminopeptidase/acylaminoacyl peptidase